MVTYKEFKKKALSNPEVKQEYENLKPIFEIKKQLIQARLNKGLTQEEVAKRMNTSKSNISRLESLSNKYVPNLMTLIKYANALGCKIDFRII
ncbi:helix-turn-helix domain-containing protein [Caminibacter pacificus]|jgi:DNA-binding XRE family transcriptional regulator